MTEYVIEYRYHSWVEGCGCCSDSSSELTVYEAHRVDEGVYTSFMEHVDLLENEQQLRNWINKCCPEFNNFTVHEDTRWF